MTDTGIRQLRDPRGEAVVFHSETAMDTEWVRCDAGLLVEVER